jgi:hypothetical protein
MYDSTTYLLTHSAWILGARWSRNSHRDSSIGRFSDVLSPVVDVDGKIASYVKISPQLERGLTNISFFQRIDRQCRLFSMIR